MLGGKITILYGENSFERSRKLAQLKNEAENSGFEVEKLSAESLDLNSFSASISAVSLFSEKRLVIIRSLSENKTVWNSLEKVLPNISADVHLCLIEEKIDKRGTFYKNLNKTADFLEFKKLEQKNAGELAELARALAKKQGLSMSLAEAKFLISWVGIDEWAVKNSIEKLAILGKTDQDSIKTYMSHNIEANTFSLFEMALAGNFSAIIEEISKLKIRGEDEGYQFFGLLTSQLFNLVSLKIGFENAQTTAEVARQIGVNAWALGKMENISRNLTREHLSQITEILIRADEKAKTTSVNIWDLAEGALLEIAEMFKR